METFLCLCFYLYGLPSALENNVAVHRWRLSVLVGIFMASVGDVTKRSRGTFRLFFSFLSFFSITYGVTGPLNRPFKCLHNNLQAEILPVSSV